MSSPSKTYKQRLQMFKTDLSETCCELVRERWEIDIEHWLDADGQYEFARTYILVCEKHLGTNSAMENDLCTAGNHLAYALQAYLMHHKQTTLDKVIDYLQCFVSTQIDNFGIWCSS
jgi:hypothetical protein